MLLQRLHGCMFALANAQKTKNEIVDRLLLLG